TWMVRVYDDLRGIQEKLGDAAKKQFLSYRQTTPSTNAKVNYRPSQITPTRDSLAWRWRTEAIN
ncbi:hypothetical protein BGZ58_002634, partial [Dissophora ornata]